MESGFAIASASVQELSAFLQGSRNPSERENTCNEWEIRLREVTDGCYMSKKGAHLWEQCNGCLENVFSSPPTILKKSWVLVLTPLRTDTLRVDTHQHQGMLSVASVAQISSSWRRQCGRLLAFPYTHRHLLEKLLPSTRGFESAGYFSYWEGPTQLLPGVPMSSTLTISKRYRLIYSTALTKTICIPSARCSRLI